MDTGLSSGRSGPQFRCTTPSYEWRPPDRHASSRRGWLKYSAEWLLAAALAGGTRAWAEDDEPATERKTLQGFPLFRQPDKISCGPTCCSMVLNYYGVVAGFRSLQKKTKTRLLKIGNLQVGFTLPSKVEKALEAFGLSSTVYQAGCSEHIVQMIDEIRPPILLVRSSQKTWHYVVAIGYDRSRSIKVADPAGHQYWLAWSVLEKAWRFDGDLRGNMFPSRRTGLDRVGHRIDLWRTLVEANLIEVVCGQMMIVPDHPAVS